jgi:hypothetical protein
LSRLFAEKAPGKRFFAPVRGRIKKNGEILKKHSGSDILKVTDFSGAPEVLG